MLLVLVTAAFTLIYPLSETANAPHEQVITPEPAVEETPEPEDINEEPEPLDEPEEEPEDEHEDEPDEPDDTPVVYDFATIHLEDSDIHSGYLVLVNHDNAFSIPDDLDLVNIVEARTTSFRVQHESSMLLRSIMEPLDEMMDAFISATHNNTVTIISAFRNREAQQRILNNYIARAGRREALRWAALPGHSEHHTGLAFDFGVMSGTNRVMFTGTGTTAWFRRNSHRFGFILRYPPDKTHITQTSHEPWHFRYVGLPHSHIMFRNNWCLEEYIDLLRVYTIDEPFEAEHDDVLYEIYFYAGTDVPVPFNSEFDISGNNVDGFIVTIVRMEVDPEEVIDVST